jgi:pimeloyl-ACP methyl ester carboxylesterase
VFVTRAHIYGLATVALALAIGFCNSNAAAESHTQLGSVVIHQTDLPVGYQHDANYSVGGKAYIDTNNCYDGNALLSAIGLDAGAPSGETVVDGSGYTTNPDLANPGNAVQSSAADAGSEPTARSAYAIASSTAALSCYANDLVSQVQSQADTAQLLSSHVSPLPAAKADAANLSFVITASGFNSSGFKVTDYVRQDDIWIRVGQYLANLVLVTVGHSQAKVQAGVGSSFENHRVALLVDRMRLLPGSTPATPAPSSSPTATGTPYPQCAPQNPPRVVVVMIRGINSSISGGLSPDPYDPLKQAQCDSTSIAEMTLGVNEFDQAGPGSDSRGTLFRLIADTGAVVLPFSYNGAYFQNNEPSRFYVTPYSWRDANDVDLSTGAGMLDQEIASIRTVWPKVKIVVIGHSLGGVVAEQWWWTYPQHASTNWNVVGVYTLDSPINGGATYLGSLDSEDGCPQIGSNHLPCGHLAYQFGALWQLALDGADPHLVATAQQPDRAIFLPFATRGDLVMELLSLNLTSSTPFNLGNSGQELGPQLFATFDTDGFVVNLLKPGCITRSVGGSAPQLFDSHKLVFRDPSNILFLNDKVLQASIASRDGTTGQPDQTCPVSDSASSGQAAAFQPVPSPVGQLAVPAARAGDKIVIRGSSLGSTAGKVLFLRLGRGSEPLNIESWTSGLVNVRAPSRVGPGIVVVTTASGRGFIAGPESILPAGGAASIMVAADQTTLSTAGQPFVLNAYPFDAAGNPMANVPVAVSNGVSSFTTRSDASGKARMSVFGYGKDHFLITSGHAWRTVTIRFLPSPTRHMTIQVSPRSPTVGDTAAVSVILTEGSGRALPGSPVSFRVFDGSPAGEHLRSTTNRAGRVQFSVPYPRSRSALIVASLPGTLASSHAHITWISSTAASASDFWFPPTWSLRWWILRLASAAFGGVVGIAVIAWLWRYLDATDRGRSHG